jgi:hypothetical protein
MDPSYLGQPVRPPYAQKSGGLMTKRTLLMLIGGILVVFAAFMLLFASGDNSGTLQQRTKARQDILLDLVADGKKNLTSDEIGKINSELYIILLSDDAELQAALKTAGLKKVDKTILAAEADSETFDTLATAKLNAQYDAKYQTVLIQKLESHRALLKELHGKSKSKSLKAAVSTEYEHLGGYLVALEKLQ